MAVWVARFAAVCAGTVLITSLLDSPSLAVVVGVTVALGILMLFVVLAHHGDSADVGRRPGGK